MSKSDDEYRTIRVKDYDVQVQKISEQMLSNRTQSNSLENIGEKKIFKIERKNETEERTKPTEKKERPMERKTQRLERVNQKRTIKS